MEKTPFLDCSACMCSSPVHHSLCLKIFSFLILVKTLRMSSRIMSPSMLSSCEHKVLNLTASGWEQRRPEIWRLSDFQSTANVIYGAHISVTLHSVKPSPPVQGLCETLPPQNNEATEKQAYLPQQVVFFFSLQMLPILKIFPVSQIFGIIFLLR